MNVNSGVSSQYRYSTTDSSSFSDGKDSSTSAYKADFSTPLFASTISSIALPKDSAHHDEEKERISQLLSAQRKKDRLKSLKLSLLALALFFALLFFLAIIEPLLVTIFTLGECLGNESHEWFEFTREILFLSLIPASLALTFYSCSRLIVAGDTNDDWFDQAIVVRTLPYFILKNLFPQPTVDIEALALRKWEVASSSSTITSSKALQFCRERPLSFKS